MTLRYPQRLASWLIPSLAMAILSAATLWLPYATGHYLDIDVDAGLVIHAGLWIDLAWLIHLGAALVILRRRALWLLFGVPFAYCNPAFFGAVFVMGQLGGK